MNPRAHPTLKIHLLATFFVALFVAVAIAGCAGIGGEATLADLHRRTPDLTEVEVGDGLAQAMEGYRQFLEDAPESALTPEAMRRLADLALEKSYGSLGIQPNNAGNNSIGIALPRPEVAVLPEQTAAHPTSVPERDSDGQLEARAIASAPVAYAELAPDEIDPAISPTADAGPVEAIALYDRILENYRDYPYVDQVLYQKARALDELGQVDQAVLVADQLIAEHPDSRHLDELLFRRGEYHFVRRRFMDAESSYASIVELGPASDYYELALYKLGWSFYKQMLLEEALQSYVMLLDHKVAAGYDFDQSEDEAEAQRVEDTYRVISLCFSELGGSDSVNEFFDAQGPRPYEHRIYRELGEFFLDKLRYADAARTYQSFMARYPMHVMAPRFSMRVVEIYEAGAFPKLVLEAKRAFASDYGVAASYWQHNDIQKAPETLAYLEANLRDLATHSHALYQEPDEASRRPAHFEEANLWYREYLASFPTGADTPGIHRRFADLLLEDERFAESAVAFETVAYSYPPHEGAAAAGYAAVYARRAEHDRAPSEAADTALRYVVESSLRFVAAFPADDQAELVLGAAADDLYSLGDHGTAIEHARRLIEDYPESERETLRGAWLCVANASFDSTLFEDAETAYVQVIALSTPEDEDVTDSLAATVYKQGELANAAGDPRSASAHFLRIAAVAPHSTIRPMAEYDAAAALITLEDWTAAAVVLDAFRANHPSHSLQRDVTRQMAHVRQADGDLALAAIEYERVANEAENPEERADALAVAGDLHEEAGDLRQALEVLAVLVTEYTDPLERLVVTRFKMATLHGKLEEATERQDALRHVVALDAQARSERTPRVRRLAAKAALELTEPSFHAYASLELNQPFERSLARKQRKLEQILSEFESLVDYGVGEVTAAATYYIAESYGEFGRALLHSERPADLAGSDRLDYEDILEEKAYPFEERTISVHEKNLDLARTRVANQWVERSLSRLAALSPGRYAKQETSAGPLEALDTYVYQLPSRLVDALVANETADPSAERPQQASDDEPRVSNDLVEPLIANESSGDREIAIAPSEDADAPPPAAIDNSIEPNASHPSTGEDSF